jgi:arginase family enzyme
LRSEDAQWPRASAWLASGAAEPRLALLGVPVNQSLTPGRCDLAPAAIRRALERFSTYDADAELDLLTLPVNDFGDTAEVRLPADCAVLLGGDNNVTRLGVHALGPPLEQIALLTFDAHHDVRDTSGGLHNGNPVRALIEAGLPGENIAQVGIQPFANSRAYAQFAREAGIHIVTAEAAYVGGIEAVLWGIFKQLNQRAAAIYVNLDADVLDRAFAPACPGARPGGLPPWMMRVAARLCGAQAKVRAMDIVEVDPTKDIADVTCLAAASFLLAFASGVASRR